MEGTQDERLVAKKELFMIVCMWSLYGIKALLDERPDDWDAICKDRPVSDEMNDILASLKSVLVQIGSEMGMEKNECLGIMGGVLKNMKGMVGFA